MATLATMRNCTVNFIFYQGSLGNEGERKINTGKSLYFSVMEANGNVSLITHLAHLNLDFISDTTIKPGETYNTSSTVSVPTTIKPTHFCLTLNDKEFIHLKDLEPTPVFGWPHVPRVCTLDFFKSELRIHFSDREPTIDHELQALVDPFSSAVE